MNGIVLDAWCNVCVWKISKKVNLLVSTDFGASWNETLRDSTGEIVSLSPDEIGNQSIFAFCVKKLGGKDAVIHFENQAGGVLQKY